MTLPLFRIIVALSDAKNIEPLENTLTLPAPDDALAESGVAAEGREVVMVSLTLPKDAACTLGTKYDPKRTRIIKQNKCATTRFIISVWRKKIGGVKKEKEKIF
jgi:hypothetical protein